MVVDDNPDMLRLMEILLKQIHDGPVDCFSSPPAALAALAGAPNSYELVITDYEMPEMDGLELCRRLLGVVRHLKIFLATGSGFFTAAAAASAGFQGMLNKPFQFEELRAMLAGAGIRIGEPVAA